MTSIALLLAAALPAAADVNPDEFFARFREAREGIVVLQAEYTEKNITPDETLMAEGVMLYAKPRRILRTTHYPYEAAVLIDGTTSYQYEPEVRQLVIHDLADSPEADILFFGFDSDVTRLRDNYDVTLFKLEDAPQGELGMELQPKAGTEAEDLFSKALLYLRDDNLLPYRVQLVFDQDSQLVVEMGEYTVNRPIDPEESQIAVAPGTTVIRNEEVVREVEEEGVYIPEPIVVTGLPRAPARLDDDDDVDVRGLDDPELNGGEASAE